MLRGIIHKKRILFTHLICLNLLSGIAQVPNGNFEEWQTIDNIENPLHWESNNYYIGYTPVAKTTDAIEGDYSMKVSSTARDFWGGATLDGCAHIKFVPNEEYLYLTASVRVDAVDMQGEVSIRVKQKDTTNGLFVNIGTWSVSDTTSGVVQVVLPIEQLGLDTLLIEVWAKNFENIFTGTSGYSEIIIDNLQLSTIVSANEVTKELAICTIFPNPTDELLKVHLTNSPTVIPDELSIADLHGKVLTTIQQPFLMANEISVDVRGLLPGLYVLSLKSGSKIIGQKRVVVN